MRERVVLVRVVAIVGSEQWRPDAPGDLDELRVGLLLLLDPVVLKLDEQVVLAEDVLQPARGLQRTLGVVAQQGLVDDAAEAAGAGDDALCVLLE